VPVPGGTGVSQIDTLLGILMVEPDLVQCLTKVEGARHALVSVGNIETAQATHIPIGITLHHVGVWLSVQIFLVGGGVMGKHISTGWGVSPIHHSGYGRSVWGNASCSVALETSWKTWVHANGATDGGRKSSLGVPSNVVRRAAAASLHATAPTTSTSCVPATTSTKGSNPAAGIADVECNGIQTINQLMHCGVVCLLIGSQLRQLHIMALTGVGGHRLHALTLVCQCSHLGCNRIGNGLLIVTLDFAEYAKCILLIQLGGCITVMPRSRCHRIQATLECLLNEAMQFDPCLGDWQESVPLLEGPNVQARGQEEADPIVDQLAICVWVITQNCNLNAIFDATEEDFGGIGSSILAAKRNIVEFQGRQSRLAIDLGQLIQNFAGHHTRMQSNDGRIIADLEGIINAGIKHGEACVFDVLHQLEVMLLLGKRSIDCSLLRVRQRRKVVGVGPCIVCGRTGING
jgi:hypothetical protein